MLLIDVGRGFDFYSLGRGIRYYYIKLIHIPEFSFLEKKYEQLNYIKNIFLAYILKLIWRSKAQTFGREKKEK